jgi:hypothetical protein
MSDERPKAKDEFSESAQTKPAKRSIIERLRDPNDTTYNLDDASLDFPGKPGR